MDEVLDKLKLELEEEKKQLYLARFGHVPRSKKIGKEKFLRLDEFN